MAKLPELTKIYINAYSDQAIQLGDAVPGFAGVEQLEDGGQYSCVVKNGVQTEKFLGTFSAASQSLTRETQNVYPAGTDKISLAADNLFVDFVMLGRDLPNDDSLRATLQSNQGASFVQSSSGSIENRLNTLDTEINDKISGSEGAVTGDGLVQGIVFSAADQTLKTTYRDGQGTHVAIVGKTPVIDDTGDSSTSAISQRAATVAINDRLSGTIYANSATDDGNGIGLHWQGDGGKAQEGLPNFQYYEMSDATKTPLFVNLITRTYFEKYTANFVSGSYAALQDDGLGIGIHFDAVLSGTRFDYNRATEGLGYTYLIEGIFAGGDPGTVGLNLYVKDGKPIFRYNTGTDIKEVSFVTADDIPAPDLSGYVAGTATNDGQITALTQDTATNRPKVTLSGGSTEILALQSDVANGAFEYSSWPSANGTVYCYKIAAKHYKMAITGMKVPINSGTAISIPAPLSGYTAPSNVLSGKVGAITSAVPTQVWNADGSNNPDYPQSVVVPIINSPAATISLKSVSGATSGNTVLNVEFFVSTDS